MDLLEGVAGPKLSGSDKKTFWFQVLNISHQFFVPIPAFVAQSFFDSAA
jgi:hypothetical protein